MTKNRTDVSTVFNIFENRELKILTFFCGLPASVVAFVSAWLAVTKDPAYWHSAIILLIFILLILFIMFGWLIWRRNRYDVDRVIQTSRLIYDSRKELWGKCIEGKEENNLLRSLVYPATSLYSVTVFVVGFYEGKPTDMLFMRAKNKDGTKQEYDALGQRMPVNSIPHNFAVSLIKKHLYDYKDKEIVFSSHFHEADKQFVKENEKIDNFTKLAPLPYRIQEESNPQSDGSPFFLDFIYVVEVTKFGPDGEVQSDLEAEWVPIENVKKYCKNGPSPKRYNGNPEKGKFYFKFTSQMIYAERIADFYSQQNSDSEK